MKHTCHLLLCGFLAALLVPGCEPAANDREPPGREERGEVKPEARKVLVGPNVFLEVEGKTRRVLVSASVCLREGPLEQLLCRKQTKEHESVLTADADARDIHKALLLTGAREGAPVRFVPRYRAASGQRIRITLKYKDKDGKLVHVPARSWIKNMKTGKALESDWVFAGSRLVDHPLNPKEKVYLANDGDVICISNFETALLDLPIESSKEDADRAFVAFTDRIPAVDTKVVVVLEPIPEPAKK
jgi:hypothetical protein